MFCYVFRPTCSDHFTDTRHTFEELLQGLNSWSIGPLTRNKLQNTEYVDNDVDVDDVDDDEEGAGAYTLQDTLKVGATPHPDRDGSEAVSQAARL